MAAVSAVSCLWVRAIFFISIGDRVLFATCYHQCFLHLSFIACPPPLTYLSLFNPLGGRCKVSMAVGEVAARGRKESLAAALLKRAEETSVHRSGQYNDQRLGGIGYFFWFTAGSSAGFASTCSCAVTCIAKLRAFFSASQLPRVVRRR